ncbi:MAG: hypothetical protein V7767_13965, partial [Leeuwenhoekiella sp.]
MKTTAIIYRSNLKGKALIALGFMLLSLLGLAQNDSKKSDEIDPALAEAKEFVAEGNDQLQQNKFTIAEASYRKAIAKDPANLPAKYNMGNNYYENKKDAEGMSRY